MRKIELDDDEVSVVRRRMLDMSKAELIQHIERLQSELYVARMNINQLKYTTDANRNFYLNSSSTTTASTLRVVVR